MKKYPGSSKGAQVGGQTLQKPAGEWISGKKAGQSWVLEICKILLKGPSWSPIAKVNENRDALQVVFSFVPPLEYTPHSYLEVPAFGCCLDSQTLDASAGLWVLGRTEVTLERGGCTISVSLECSYIHSLSILQEDPLSMGPVTWGSHEVHLTIVGPGVSCVDLGNLPHAHITDQSIAPISPPGNGVRTPHHSLTMSYI